MNDQDIHELEHYLQSFRPQPLSDSQLGLLELCPTAGELATIQACPLSASLLDQLDERIATTELSSVPPTPLSEELLTSLECATLEAELAQHSAPVLSNDLLSRLTVAAELAETEGEEGNVIQFPQNEAAPSAPEKNAFSWKWVATAAAVAMLGMFTGLQVFTPASPGANGLVTGPTAPHSQASVLPTIQSDQLLNVSKNSEPLLRENQGLIYSPEKDAYFKATKVVTMESFLLETSEGKTVKVQRPVEKVIFVPVATD